MNSNDRANLIKRINTLEGLTDKERSALLGLLRENKTYGLVWEDKPEDVEERLRDELPILTEVPERTIISEDKDAPNHILIEGDNLEALATLAYTHEGKIDVIYIDPPYNTGNKDFIYNDSYVDKEDSYRHSKWLSFMSRRLTIAKKLLSERGVIFISIDDNEYAQLKLLCDSSDLLGEGNYIATLIWAAGRKNDSKYISISHEYILCYVRSAEFLRQNGIIWREKKQGIEDIYKITAILKKKYGSDYRTMSYALKEWYKTLPANHPAKNHSHYNCIDERGVYFPADISWPGGGGPKYTILHPVTHKPVKIPNRGWVYPTKERMEEVISLGLVHFGENENSVPCKKTYLLENEYTTPYSIFYKDGRAATKRLRSLMGYVAFQNPKDEEIIQNIFSFSSSKDSIILDFFAGSGTTLHATMLLNAEDGGRRQCILVTNNENNICEEVTYERNKRVIQGYTNAKGEEVAGLTKNNLRYYRTGFVGRNRSMQNMRKLVNLATDMLCIKEDLYTEQKTFGGQKTYKGIFRYFDDGKKQMLVIYREEAIDELVDIIYDLDIIQPIKVYVFSPSEDPWEGSFDDVSDKVELCALPQAIYNTYRRILPKKKDAVVFPEEDVLATTEKEEEQFNGMLNFEYD